MGSDTEAPPSGGSDTRQRWNPAGTGSARGSSKT